MNYHIAEKFKSPQGEGVYAGTPMAFIRFVGCSVGKRICQHCDTDFDKPYHWLGGGTFDEEALREWVGDYEHVCLTGGEPLDQELFPLLRALAPFHVHMETSGTKEIPEDVRARVWWICVSPKPGFIEHVVQAADEVKVIVPGLGTDESLVKMFRISPTGDPDDMPPLDFRWPTLIDALRWAKHGTPVFLQPRNGKFDIDKNNLALVQELVAAHPSLRLSMQLHKLLRVR